MRRLVLALGTLLLVSCTERAALVHVASSVPDAQIQSVYVSTTRVFDGKRFGAGRAEDPQYLRYDISVPPRREVGSINWPEREADPATQFVAAGGARFPGADAFRRDLSRALARHAMKDREAFIYVHGFNNRFEEGVLRTTQLVADFDIKGVAVHYAWPSAGNPLGYAYDRDSLLISRDGLDALITQVRAAGARRVVIVAHSVGSMLVMETLRQRAIARPGSVMREINGVILISPDIDVDLFRSQARRIGQLPQPFGIFVSKRDRVLSLSARLTGQRNRLGNVDNVEQVADLDVAIVDVTDFSEGAGHFTVGSSPALIRLFRQAGAIDAAFKGDNAGRAGLIPGTILTVQNTTGFLLSPMKALAEAVE